MRALFQPGLGCAAGGKEIADVEDLRILIGKLHHQDEADVGCRALKVGDTNPVQPFGNAHSCSPREEGVHAVVVDHALIVDVELRSVVGIKTEMQPGRFRQPEDAAVVDGIPLRSGKAVPGKGILIVDRQRICVEIALGVQAFKVGKKAGVSGIW